MDLCLRSEDVQYFISLILALSHEAKRLRPVAEFDVPPRTAIPLPITATPLLRRPLTAATVTICLLMITLPVAVGLVARASFLAQNSYHVSPRFRWRPA